MNQQFFEDNNNRSRSPFMPIRQPTTPMSTNNTPTTPLPNANRLMKQSSIQSFNTTRQPLNSITPSVSISSSSPTTEFIKQGGLRKVINNNSNGIITTDNSLLPPSSTAPRIRARVSPSATPRRKPLVLPHSYAETTTPIASTSRTIINGVGSPIKRNPLPIVPMLTSSIINQNQSTFLSKVSNSNKGGEGEQWNNVDNLDKSMNGLAINTMNYENDLEFEDRKSKKGKDNVLVCLRVRPPALKLAVAASTIAEEAWDVNSSAASVMLKNGTSEFVFDSVVTGSDNEGVYQEAGKDLVLAAMEGFDAVIFAYGQTASGKTFTLSGNTANPGIIPQAVTEIFSYIRDHPEKEFLLRASYLEIYNETLKDLLAPESGALKIRQDEQKRFFVHPLREEVVTGEMQVAALLKRGEENRHTGRTDFNERSSRSHSVFQITIESRMEDTNSSPTSSIPATPLRSKTPNGPRLSPGANGIVQMSRLSLIDLAGSEQATSQTERRSEGAFINKSLLTLEKVIASLTDEGKKRPHVPYRDSKLTQILQPSLAGDARVSVIATMNPSSSAVEETKSTLKFAQRVKKVMLKAKVNEVVDDKALIHKYRSHIQQLEAQLSIAMAAVPSTPNPEVDHRKKRQEAEEIRTLKSELEEIKSLFLTSGNVEGRRQSMLPPRPVSPTKMRRMDQALGDGFEEKYLDCQDELQSRLEDIEELKSRILELEEERLEILKNDATESDKDARIAQLFQENRELQIIQQNIDPDSELRRQQRKFERQLERCTIYETELETSLNNERLRVQQFERYILQHLSTQAEKLSSRHPHSSAYRNSSIGGAGMRPMLEMEMGFSPIMTESPDLSAISPAFVDLEDLIFSKEGRSYLVKSGSMLLPVVNE